MSLCLQAWIVQSLYYSLSNLFTIIVPFPEGTIVAHCSRCYVLRPFALAILRQTFIIRQPGRLFISGCSSSFPKTKNSSCGKVYARFGLSADKTEQVTPGVQIIHLPDAVAHLCLWCLLLLQGQYVRTITFNQRATKLQMPG